MIIRPIIPIWLMIIICLALLFFALKCKNKIRLVLRMLIVLCLFLINLRFSGETIGSETLSTNLNVVFVIDTTISMKANDYANGQKTRFDGVTEDCEYIMEKLPGSYAIITFDNTSNIRMPLTKDKTAIKNILKSDPVVGYFYAHGSSMNVAKKDMTEILERSHNSQGKRTVVFFMSDGENTNGEASESFSSIKDYIDDGAVIGFGTSKGGNMLVEQFYGEEKTYVKDYDLNSETEIGGKAIAKIDEDNLKNLAKDLDVEYIHAEKTSDLDNKIDEIKNSIQSSPDNDKFSKEYTDYYYVLSIPLILLLLAELCFCRKEVI